MESVLQFKVRQQQPRKGKTDTGPITLMTYSKKTFMKEKSIITVPALNMKMDHIKGIYQISSATQRFRPTMIYTVSDQCLRLTELYSKLFCIKSTILLDSVITFLL